MIVAFETWAANTPASIAVRFESKSITYAELNRRTNRLAHFLLAEGISTGDRVGLYLHRSVSMVISALAILKTGATCVPLEAADPQSRNRRILTNSEPKALLTEESLIQDSKDWPGRFYSVDSLRLPDVPETEANPKVTYDAQQPALLVYTSGSTGMPKGVMLSHANLSHYVNALGKALELSPNDTYVYRGSIALVVSARQLLMPLASGASVAMTNAEQSRTPQTLLSWTLQSKATLLDHAPSFWRACARAWPHDSEHLGANSVTLPFESSIRLVGTGGEPATPEVVTWLRQAFPAPVRLVNLYGQSEGDGVVTISEIDPTNVANVPIGKPIENMKVLLLNSHGRPVVSGEEGEICISGRGVALGYYGLPEVTADQFVRNQLSSTDLEDHPMIYHTGDLGRLRADGEIEFVGRRDDQVNIRGYRVELAEIEDAIEALPQVQACSVTSIPDSTGATRLAAYLVLEQGSQPCERSSATWHNLLKGALPSHMIPSAFECLDSLPMTQSGKVDRSALPPPNFDPASLSNENEHASTDLEKRLSEIWARFLGTEHPSTDLPFTVLGGDSLKAVALLIEIQRDLGLTLPIKLETVLSHSIRSMAELVEQLIATGELPLIETVQEGDHSAPLFIVHAVNGLNWFASLFARNLPSAQTVYALYWHPSSGADVSDNHMEAYASRLTDTILAKQPQGPFRLLGISFGAQVAFQIARELIHRGHEPQFVGLVDENTDAFMRCFRRRKYQPESNRIDHLCIHMLRSYVPYPYPGNLYLFQSTSKQSDVLADPYAGWRELCLQKVVRHEIPGSHLTLMRDGNLRQWGHLLASSIEEATQLWRQNQSQPDRVKTLRGRLTPDSLPLAKKQLILAQEAAKKGLLTDEIAHYESALSETSDLPYWAFRNLAGAYWDNQQRTKAIHFFEEAVKREQVPLAGLRILANRFKALGRTTDAEACLNRLSQVCPPTPEGYVEWADALIDHQRYEQAETVLAKAQAVAPKHIYTDFGFAKLDLHRANIPQGIERIKRLLDLMPNDISFLNLYAQLLNAQKSFEAATPILEQLIQIQPNDLWLRSELFKTFLQQRKEKEAIASLEAIAGRLPTSADSPDLIRQVWAKIVGCRVSQIPNSDLFVRVQCRFAAIAFCGPISRWSVKLLFHRMN